MKQGIIFDMDGTLFQTDQILEGAIEDTFDHLRSLGKWEGVTPLEEYRKIMGVPLPVVWETLLPNHSEADRAQVDTYFLERLIEQINQGRGALYPRVEATFQDLKAKGYDLFIASNGLVDYLNAIVRYYQLNRWVTETFSIQQIDSDDKADLVRTILDQYTIADGAVVGDRSSDVRAAKGNGLTAIGCQFDFARDGELAQADRVVDDLGVLQKIFT
ncbi:adenosylhomocysteine nucleosidase [Alkalibacillus almallahensis]|nr:HAD hydrolase-like protein [Alkalibacillus almallahensis]NIK12600.1 adenosylhomocysteine nucleosidase [Alkalibacillus almallahensis]